MQAINGSSSPALDPIQALNAQPVNLPMGGATMPDSQQPPAATASPDFMTPAPNMVQPAPNPVIQPQFDAMAQNGGSQPPQFGMPQPQPQFNNAGMQPQVADPNAPPPVPPPMMPPLSPY
jgi:hypothetical protein